MNARSNTHRALYARNKSRWNTILIGRFLKFALLMSTNARITAHEFYVIFRNRPNDRIVVPSKTAIGRGKRRKRGENRGETRSAYTHTPTIFSIVRQSVRYPKHLAASVHLTNPDFSILASSARGRASSPAPVREPLLCLPQGPGFSRSTPSAGTPRELSAKRQYALPRRLFIHPWSPGLTPSPWPS